MRQFNLYGGLALRFGQINEKNLPFGICLNPECVQYQTNKMIACKYGGSCKVCTHKLVYTLKAKRFIRERIRLMKKDACNKQPTKVQE